MSQPDDDDLDATANDAPSARHKRNRSGAATRRRILQVATTLFAAGGYEATSLRQIAIAAEVDLATLKYHIGDKALLFAEVYRQGHAELIRHVEPVLAAMHEVSDEASLRACVRLLVANFHDFIEDNREFIRMVLFRMLEDPSNMSALENELQGLAVTLVERALSRLIEAGIARPIDARALIAFIATALPMWFVTCEVKPGWIGDPNPATSAEGRARSEQLFVELLERALLPLPTLS